MPSGPPSRLTAAARREQLTAAAVDLARRDGVTALTLARVADAGGVSKPIAYRHFGTLAGLLRAVHDHVGSDYERVLAARLDAGADVPARQLCAAYVDCSLANGALLDDVGAALAAAGGDDRLVRVETAQRYADVVSRAFAPRGGVLPFTLALLGAADRLCEAVVAGRIDRDTAVDALVDAFDAP